MLGFSRQFSKPDLAAGAGQIQLAIALSERSFDSLHGARRNIFGGKFERNVGIEVSLDESSH